MFVPTKTRLQFVNSCVFIHKYKWCVSMLQCLQIKQFPFRVWIYCYQCGGGHCVTSYNFSLKQFELLILKWMAEKPRESRCSFKCSRLYSSSVPTRALVLQCVVVHEMFSYYTSVKPCNMQYSTIHCDLTSDLLIISGLALLSRV